MIFCFRCLNIKTMIPKSWFEKLMSELSLLIFPTIVFLSNYSHISWGHFNLNHQILYKHIRLETACINEAQLSEVPMSYWYLYNLGLFFKDIKMLIDKNKTYITPIPQKNNWINIYTHTGTFLRNMNMLRERNKNLNNHNSLKAKLK